MASARERLRHFDSRAMDRRPMALSSGFVIRNRLHGHPLLSVLPPEKLRGTRYARSQELLFLALGDRNRACALRGVARSCTKWRRARGRLHDRSPYCAPLRTVEPHTTTLMQLSRARCGIVRHRRCLNPRLPRSTPSAYSRREAQGRTPLRRAIARTDYLEDTHDIGLLT